MPNIGNHVDAVFIPESVNTSTTLKINGGDLNVNNGQFFVDQSTTNVGIGTTQPQHLLDIWGEGAHTAQLTLRQWNDNSITDDGGIVDGPDMRFIASGGTIASPAEMDDNDVIGKVNGFAFDGTNSVQYGGFGWRYRTDGLGSRGSSFSIETRSLTESTNSSKINITQDGVVELYHIADKKLETTSTGVEVTGSVIQQSSSAVQPLINSTGAQSDLFFRCGNNAYSTIVFGDQNNTIRSGIRYNAATDRLEFKGASMSSTHLYVDSSSNLTLTGELRGPASFVIDPAAVGDNTGTVVIKGDLQVDGTTTTINSTTLTVDDKNIVLASGAADSAAADGAGITVDGAAASLLYSSTTDAWSFNKNVGIGTESPASLLEVVTTSPTITTRATGNNSAKLALDGNRAADVIGGQIIGRWNGNDIARIDLRNGLDGTNKDDGEIAFATSANNSTPSERVRIDSSGNVGIGTINPDHKLDVRGEVQFIGTAGNTMLGISDNTSYIRNVNDGTDNAGNSILQMGGGDGSYVIAVQDGRGRVNHSWNATVGSSEEFLVDGENAFWLEMSPDTDGELFKLRKADGSGASAGDAISWTPVFGVDTDGLKYWGGYQGNYNSFQIIPSDPTSTTQDPTILRITSSEASTGTSPGDAYGAIEFAVYGAEINDDQPAAQTVTNDVIAAIKAIDWRNDATTNEDAGIGFYTTEAGVATPALTFRGGFSNDGGFYVGDNPKQGDFGGKLHVDYNTSESSIHYYAANIVVTNDSGVPDAFALTNRYDRDIGMVLRTGDSNGTSSTNRWYIWNDGANSGGNNNRFNISPDGTSSNGITILQNNNIGIGKGSPEEKLHVTGSIKLEAAAPFIKYAETGVTGNPVFWVGQDAGNFSVRLNNSAPHPFQIMTKGANSDAIDYVAIGGETEQARFKVTAATTQPTYVDLISNANNTRIRFYETTTERWNIGYDTGNNAFTFYDPQAAATRIKIYDGAAGGIVIGAEDNGGFTYPTTDGGGAATSPAALRIDGGAHAALFCYNDEQSADPVAIFAKGNEADDNQIVIIAGDGDGEEELLDIRSNTNPTVESDILSFARDNANSKFRVYGDGRVYTPYRIGVGTTDPSSQLDVIGNFEFRSPDANDTTNTKIIGQFDGAGTRNTYFRIGANENRRASIVFSGVNTSTDASTDYWSIGRGDSDELNASSFFIATGESGGNTAKLVIDLNGNVGIGTTNPLSLLMVGSPAANTSSYITFGKRIATSETNLPFIGQNDADGNGNNDLGLGACSSGGDVIIYAGNANPFTSNVERLRVAAGGNVGIGTTNPSQKLEINGNVAIGSTLINHHSTNDDDSLLPALKLEGVGYLLNREATTSNSSVLWGTIEPRPVGPSTKTWSEAGNVGNVGTFFTNVYGEADLSGITGDVEFTYAAAVAALEAVGARLPTVQEIMDEAGAGSGQGYDSFYLWTQTFASPNHVWVVHGRYDANEAKIVDITDPAEVYRVRGFFDVSKANMPVYFDNDEKIRTSEVKAQNNSLLLTGAGGTGITVDTSGNVSISESLEVNGLTVGAGSGGNAANSVFGTDAFASNVTGFGNVVMGKEAMYNNVGGNNNIALGTTAMFKTTSGSRNIAIGDDALYSLHSFPVSSNIAIGSSAMEGNVNTIASELENGTTYEISSNTDADFTTVGAPNNDIGTTFTATGPVSSGIGFARTRITGDSNVAVGSSALYGISTGRRNAAVGASAMIHVNTGENNVAIGYEAGRYRQNGSNMTSFDNCTHLGRNTRASGSNQVQLGDSSTTTYAYGSVQNRSDARDKTDVRDTLLGLNFIKSLRPVDFRWDYREKYFEKEEVTLEDGTVEEQLVAVAKDGSRAGKRFHHGLIAQEVKAAADAQGVDFAGYQDHSINGGDDVLSIGYAEMIAPLVKAVQELSAENAALKARLDDAGL